MSTGFSTHQPESALRRDVKRITWMKLVNQVNFIQINQLARQSQISSKELPQFCQTNYLTRLLGKVPVQPPCLARILFNIIYIV